MSGTMLSAPGFGSKEQFTVPSEKVGLLIGKGGSKIKEIQQVSGARMDIAKLSEPATPHLRHVSLSGSAQSVATAKGMIDAIVNEIPRGARGPGHNAPYNPKKTIQIPSSTVGLVIGKGGDNIRKIIQDTGSTIHIEKEGEAELAGRPPPPPGYQNVYLKGSDEAVMKAEHAILDLVSGDLQRKRQRVTQPPQYGQFGQQQFVIPQYQQAYGFQPFAPQQIYGFQQPFAVPGQSLMQPTYGVMPGYPSQGYLQAPPQPGTIGLAQYTAGNPQAQFQAAAVYQHPGMLNNTRNGSAVAGQPQFIQTQQFSSLAPGQPKPPTQPAISQHQPNNVPMAQDQHPGQFGGMQSQAGQLGAMQMRMQVPPGSNMAYNMQVGGGPNRPPMPFNTPSTQSSPGAKGPPGVFSNPQFSPSNAEVNVNRQFNPPGIQPNIQSSPQEVSSHSPPNIPYNSQGVIVNNAQKKQVDQINGGQNLVPPINNAQGGANSRVNG